MPHQVLIQRLAFQPVDPDNPTVQAGPEQIVERGGLVPDYVSEFIISALSAAGVIVPVSEPDPLIIPRSEEPALPLPNPEQPPPPGTGQMVPAPQQHIKPKVTDSKDAWEDYAASVGMDRAEAESLNKAKLIAEVNRREDEAKAADQPTPGSTVVL